MENGLSQFDYGEYAVKFGLVESLDEIKDFRYACYTGERAVRKLFEYRNRPIVPRLVLQNKRNPEKLQPLLENLKNHVYDGENVENLVKDNFRLLSEQKTAMDEILQLSSSCRILDKSLKFTLPQFTADKSKTLPDQQTVMSLFLRLPEERPLKRDHIKNLLRSEENVDIYLQALIVCDFL